MDAEYLGDGVYVQKDEYGGIVLTTGNHEPRLADNIIVLEPEVAERLVKYLTTFLAKKV